MFRPISDPGIAAEAHLLRALRHALGVDFVDCPLDESGRRRMLDEVAQLARSARPQLTLVPVRDLDEEALAELVEQVKAQQAAVARWHAAGAVQDAGGGEEEGEPDDEWVFGPDLQRALEGRHAVGNDPRVLEVQQIRAQLDQQDAHGGPLARALQHAEDVDPAEVAQLLEALHEAEEVPDPTPDHQQAVVELLAALGRRAGALVAALAKGRAAHDHTLRRLRNAEVILGAVAQVTKVQAIALDAEDEAVDVSVLLHAVADEHARGDQALEVLRRFLTGYGGAYHHDMGRLRVADHACAVCVEVERLGRDAIQPGFRCPYHAALDLVDLRGAR